MLRDKFDLFNYSLHTSLLVNKPLKAYIYVDVDVNTETNSLTIQVYSLLINSVLN